MGLAVADLLMELVMAGYTDETSCGWICYYDQLWLDPLMEPNVVGTTNRTIHLWDLLWLDPLIGPAVAGSANVGPVVDRIH